MDQLFVNLIGKPKLNPSGRIITLTAENFSVLEDQAKFLKATVAIPTEKQLPLNDVKKQLLQFGPLHSDIRCQLEKTNWTITQCDKILDNVGESGESFCKQLDEELSHNRSLIFVNDASRVQLSLGDTKRWKKFLRLLYKWRHSDRHFVVVLYQQSQPVCTSSTAYLRDLEYISDGYLTTRSFKSCYLQSMWFRPIDRTIKTLIPPKVETHYYTCKIGKSYWSADLLCFYDRNRVPKGHDPDLNLDATKGSVTSPSEQSSNARNGSQEDAIGSALQKVGLDDEEDQSDLNTVPLPYIKAQNPEQSRIFYYPDKNDDVDEDDPDDDLGI